MPINPAVELSASAVCRRTSLAGPIDDVPSSVIVIVGANAGGISDRTLRITRDAFDGESDFNRVELVSVGLAAGVPDSRGVTTLGRLEFRVLPCDGELTLSPGSDSVEFVCGFNTGTVVEEPRSKELLLKPPACEFVFAVGSVSGTPTDRPPVAI